MARPRILILAHDAGGAEVLAALLRREGCCCAWTVLTLAGSPAESAFGQACADADGRLQVLESQAACAAFVRAAQAGPEAFDAALYNPGWGPFPQRLVEDGLLGRVPCAAVLDSWSDYRERFGYPDEGWERGLPERIALGDGRALALARELGLPRLARLRNHHMEGLLERIAARRLLSPPPGGDLLFLSQTTADPGMSANGNGRFVYAGGLEAQVLAELLARREDLAARFGVSALRLRLHPSETRCRHLDLLEQGGLPYRVERAQEADLVDSVLAARLVVGLNTMALFTAFLCGRPTASILPDPALGRVLPLPPGLLHASVAALLRSPGESSTTESPPLELFPDAGLADLLNQLLPGQAGLGGAPHGSGQ